MSWQFWKKRKQRTNAGVIEPITKGQSEGGGREHRHMPSCLENPDCPSYKPLPAGLEATIETRGGKLTAISIQPSPMIHQVTAPIVWRDMPIGSRFGPARCNPECTEVHAYAEKVSPTTVAFMRPCCPEDMGAAEWRARQKRG